jgi:Fe-Mn family superoxide dismutase
MPSQQELQAELPQLPYDFNALEPVISAEIMQLHYTKHHQAYVNNLNKALEQYADAENKKDFAQMIALQSAIKFNGGGHVNHSIFWTNLTPEKNGGGELAAGTLLEAINKEFGSKEALIEQFSTKAVAIQGSGWGWLGYNKAKKRLEIATCDNQDPLSTKGLIPLLGIDVWEHAYYLQYKNVRADYVKAIWNIINWKNVQERFQASLLT